MAGLKYHIKNKISKREIRKHGKNIIPLMQKEEFYEAYGIRIHDGGNREDKNAMQNVPSTKSDSL